MHLHLRKQGIALCALLMIAPTVPVNASSMKTGGLTSQPIGHYEFCRVYRDQCMRLARMDEIVALTRENWNEILDINARINTLVQPQSDLAIYGKDEVWTFPDQVGDCEDYVLLKRQLLMDAGFAASSLLITVVRKPDGEGHAVLTVRTDRGDFILDNLRNDVRLWKDTEYTYLKRQSERHAGHWVSIEMPDPIVVGTVR